MRSRCRTAGPSDGTAAGPAYGAAAGPRVQRSPAEVRYTQEPAALRAGYRDPRPSDRELILRAARRLVIGDAEAGLPARQHCCGRS